MTYKPACSSSSIILIQQHGAGSQLKKEKKVQVLFSLHITHDLQRHDTLIYKTIQHWQTVVKLLTPTILLNLFIFELV